MCAGMTACSLCTSPFQLNLTVCLFEWKGMPYQAREDDYNVMYQAREDACTVIWRVCAGTLVHRDANSQGMDARLCGQAVATDGTDGGGGPNAGTAGFGKAAGPGSASVGMGMSKAWAYTRSHFRSTLADFS